MTFSALHESGKVLEHLFFRAPRAVPSRGLSPEDERSIREMCEHTGVSDFWVLARVVALGVSAETMAAFSLVPMLAVAWGDEVMDDAERAAILEEAMAIGLNPLGETYELLASWLTREPNTELVAAWKAFHRELKPHLDAEARRELRAAVMVNARRVAKASGGLFGVGAISREERAAITELDQILSE